MIRLDIPITFALFKVFRPLAWAKTHAHTVHSRVDANLDIFKGTLWKDT